MGDDLHDTRPKPPPRLPEVSQQTDTHPQAAAGDTQELKALLPQQRNERFVEPPQRAERRHPSEKPKRDSGLIPLPDAPVAPARPPMYVSPPATQPSLAPPVWSVALMLFGVMGMVSCVVVALLALGGNIPPNASPRLQVITAVVPTNTPFVPMQIAATPLPNFGGISGTVQPFSLIGPTLQPIVLSPTPRTIGVGDTVFVNSEGSGLNVRSGAGIQNGILFVAAHQEQFSVVGGPTQADGLTWWELQSPLDATRRGWAAAGYLQLPS